MEAKNYPVPEITTKDGFQYYFDRHGVIHQLNPKPIEYTSEYVDTYRSEQYQKDSRRLQRIRLDFVIDQFEMVRERKPFTILDAGFGDGSFLRTAMTEIPTCYGLDVTGENVPEGCGTVNDYRYTFDAVCFWDVFEHIEDLSFIKNLPASMVFMSMPDVSDKDFETWKHRKPNEHLHHFTPFSLISLMLSYGWSCVSYNHDEDEIRKGEPKNIMSLAFIKTVQPCK